MLLVRETILGDWQALRDIRLEALRDAPSAFGSSYASEVARDEAHWRGRSSGGGMFLAYLTEVSEPSVSIPVGLAGGYQADPVTVELVSMYVRPRGRGRGVGEALVAAVIGWAAARRATSVHLWVTETNTPARALYQRCGFALTGERQPLPSDPGISEVAMARPLAAAPAARPAAAELGAGEVSAHEVGAHEVGAGEVGAGEVSAHEVSAHEVSAGGVSAGDADPSSAELRPDPEQPHRPPAGEPLQR